MNKLEELKALIAEEKKWLKEYINARNAGDEKEDVASFRLSLRVANKMRLALSEELLHDLIAVAEAAKDILESGDLHYQDCYEIRKAREDILKSALLPLTKDTERPNERRT